MKKNNDRAQPFGGVDMNIEDRESLVKQVNIKDEVNL